MSLLGQKEWTEVAEEAEFENDDRKFVDLGEDNQIGLFKLDEGYYAISAWCSHEKTSLVHGEIDGCEIMCPLHGARFDLRDGKALSMPAVKPVASYPVRVENGKIYIKI